MLAGVILLAALLLLRLKGKLPYALAKTVS
jgi:hypothetical protein